MISYMRWVFSLIWLFFLLYSKSFLLQVVFLLRFSQVSFYNFYHRYVVRIFRWLSPTSYGLWRSFLKRFLSFNHLVVYCIYRIFLKIWFPTLKPQRDHHTSIFCFAYSFVLLIETPLNVPFIFINHMCTESTLVANVSVYGCVIARLF